METNEIINIIKEFAFEYGCNFSQCVPIKKCDLVIGKTYMGVCRNASEAIWKGDVFEYDRYKWGLYYKETIKHYEDDDGYDVFVPIEIINK